MKNRYELVTITWGQNVTKEPSENFYDNFADAAEQAKDDNKDFDGTLCTVEVLDQLIGKYYGGNEL
jgi:hypothetical protein